MHQTFPSSVPSLTPSFFLSTVIGAVNLVGKKRRGEQLSQRSAFCAIILKVCVAFHGSTDLGKGFVNRRFPEIEIRLSLEASFLFSGFR